MIKSRDTALNVKLRYLDVKVKFVFKQYDLAYNYVVVNDSLYSPDSLSFVFKMYNLLFLLAYKIFSGLHIIQNLKAYS